MLSELMSKATCAECKYCCSFKRTSLWEVPTFPADKLKKLAKDADCKVVTDKCGSKSFAYCDLSGEYLTKDPAEEAPCPFLDENTGCVLSDDDKPFDCKLWPFRVVRKGDHLFLAISIACPSIMTWELEHLRAYAEEHLRGPVRAYTDKNPYIIKDLKEGYIALIEI